MEKPTTQERLDKIAEMNRLEQAAQTHVDSAIRRACKDRADQLRKELEQDYDNEKGHDEGPRQD